MHFSVLSGCSPIRVTCMGLNSYQSKLNHANVKEVPAKSTLSDINKELSVAVFAIIFSHFNGLYCNLISDSTLPPKVLSNLFFIDDAVNFIDYQGGMKGAVQVYNLNIRQDFG